jgi:peptidoglycan glycosyltransferase
MYLIHFICHSLLFLNTQKTEIFVLYGLEVVFFVTSYFVYRFVYKNLSRLVFNNMQMLLTISFIMLARLDTDLAKRQLFMAAAGLFLCLVVPFVIEKFSYIDRLGWGYGILGLILLFTVFIPKIGVEKYGASNWIQIGSITLQPSEFVKIIFVFFIAALLSGSTEFKKLVKITVVAAVYVLVLVLERDLGGALIFFVTYLCVLYAATSRLLYVVTGLGAFSVASVIAYRLFSHVRVRVQAFLDPWSDIDSGGYQVASSLFAIGTGGWFGMGLGKGLPQSIPVRESDFIFSAISEEMGGIFAICLILVCLSCFIMFVNIAMKMKRLFYKLTALGLSVIYIFQVFLTIGGAIKFIPSTGVTLPLVSYGGSSVLSTIFLFSIIQGMYVLNQDEVRANEEKEGY